MPPVIFIPIVIALGGAFLSGVHPAFGFAGAAIALSWVAGLWLAERVSDYHKIKRRRALAQRTPEEKAEIRRLLRLDEEHGSTSETLPF